MFRKLALAALSASAIAMPLAATTANAAPKGCPPGLASKGCVPPGQAKKMYKDRSDDRGEHRWRTGDRLTGDYVIIRDPQRYGLRDGTYYRSGGEVFRVDPDTRRILDVIGAVAALTNN
ncbi:hypothetical protein GCM10011415_01800 [Salipiger pallidus]|uniref:Excinuclease ABC subunit A n=1 Tax=Salipiger pallidus TaxID=1775170 RepID=A0A8J2ZGH0_9RHOB|nr:excinuclease ABC subunit A [Salipiger pallidus]GGG59569.1 hypothetical protein GCM10011415_01800 [Salipiger pallidus]